MRIRRTTSRRTRHRSATRILTTTVCRTTMLFILSSSVAARFSMLQRDFSLDLRLAAPSSGSPPASVEPHYVVIFPILFPITSVNQTLAVRAGPAVMPSGLLRPVGIGNSLITTPAVVIRPILPTPKNSVNQRLPSGPFVMPKGLLPDVGTANSVMTPLVVMRPILFPVFSVNQRLPSGPAVIPSGPLPKPSGTGNSVMTPLVVMRPMLLPLASVNQRLPSGPLVMPSGKLLVEGTGNSLITAPAVVMRPILFAEPEDSVNQRLPSGPAVMPKGLLPDPVRKQPFWHHGRAGWQPLVHRVLWLCEQDRAHHHRWGRYQRVPRPLDQ